MTGNSLILSLLLAIMTVVFWQRILLQPLLQNGHERGKRHTDSHNRKEKEHMQPTFTSHDFGMPWEKLYGFTQAIRVGPTLYISGQLSHDMEANFVGEGDFELQVRTTFANLDRVLAS